MGASPTLYRFEAFVLDATRRSLSGPAGPVALRPKVFDVLLCLLEHGGGLMTKQAAFDAAWPGLAVSDDSLARCISDIRAALGDREQRLIKTVPGRGYCLAVPVLPEPPADRVATPPPLADRPAIAVLPFAGIGGDAEEGFFADGMTEDITAALSRLRGVLVIGRNTTLGYRDRAVDARVLGRDLGVRYVLDGSVRRAGGRLRVAVHLLDAGTAGQLWSERYDGRVADVFAIQDEIAGSIVARIGTELLAAEYARASRKPPHSLDAWECVVRAMFHASRQSEEETRRALALLDQALAHDPGYAQALGMKAWILVFRAFQGWQEMGSALAQATGLIARAMAEDNGELWPYLAQAMVGFAIRDNALSMAALTRATALSPSSVNAHGLLSIAHAFGGRGAEAMAAIAHAMRLSPRDTYLSDFELYNAFIHVQAGRDREGLAFAHRAHLLRPGHAYPLLLAAACAGHLGEREAGRRFMEDLRCVVPMLSVSWVETTSPYLRREDRSRITEGLRRAGL